MMVPVAGVLSSWLFFDEIPDLVELVAGVAVIGGVLFASRPAPLALMGPRRPLITHAGCARFSLSKSTVRAFDKLGREHVP